MAISHLQAQKRLQKLCDDNGEIGIPCRVCRKLIYPPDSNKYDRGSKETPPETYHYIAKGGYEYFVHTDCMKEVRT